VPIKGGQKPKHLTTGTQGATHSPALSPNGNKAVWLELAKDGYETDHASIVVYDLQEDIKFFVSSAWDRSPDDIAVCTVF
jgi:dipeptidyl aminopeptidase/acylaminoacyl peptidase